MTSDIARDTINEMVAEGFRPSFDDCVRLNALGLKVERGESAADLSALPRASYLGDLILWEPTIAVRQWMDAAAEIVAPDYFSQLALAAYALNTPASELPRLDRSSKLVKAVKKFVDECLAPFTETQVNAAVLYALQGNNADDFEDAEPTEAEKEARRKCREIPSAMRSTARRLFASACALTIPDAERFTISALDEIITTAVALKGRDAFKEESGRATADFYRTADAIKARLIKEKDDGKEQH